MTNPRDDDRFEVPLERLPGGRRQGRRAGIVAAGVVVVLGGAFAIARLDDHVADSRPPTGSATAAGPSPSPGPSSWAPARTKS
jgi:hypothetical protein